MKKVIPHLSAGPVRAERVPSRSRTPSADRCDPRVEDYLDQVFAPLVGRLPYDKRQELRAEWRLHLESLIAAHEELDTALGAEGDPVARALAQFGDPRIIARHWQQRRPSGLKRTSSSILPAMAVGLCAFTAALCIASWVANTVLLHLYPVASLTLIVLLLPLIAGMCIGHAAPHRAGMGAFLAISLVIAANEGISLLLRNEVGQMLCVTQFAFWLPIGSLTAALTGWMKQHYAWSLQCRRLA